MYSLINRRINLDENFKALSIQANKQFAYIFFENYFL